LAGVTVRVIVADWPELMVALEVEEVSENVAAGRLIVYAAVATALLL
jgi:hypothetical protein